MILNVVTKEEFSDLKVMLKEILQRLPAANSSVMEDRVLTAKELKELLKCSDSTLSNYRNSGILPAKKIGGRYYYTQSYVNRLLNDKIDNGNKSQTSTYYYS